MLFSLTRSRITRKPVFGFYLRAVLLTLRYPIMSSHLRHLWPLWPSLCSLISPPPRPITAHAHLAGPAGRAAGPGLPGLPSIQSSWRSHLPILLLSKTIKTQKIYNKSVAGSGNIKEEELCEENHSLKAEIMIFQEAEEARYKHCDAS